MQGDIYWKLRPPPPTPEDEICRCSGRPPIKLAGGLSPNPICCLDCNLEVPPEVTGLSAELVEELVRWARLYGAVYTLWLDSGEYEAWAGAELDSPHSAVNKRGLEVARKLDADVACYFWWFEDVDPSGDAVPRSVCPVCGRAMRRYDRGIFPQSLCDRCRVVAVAPRLGSG